jgi:hypothetical protein
MKPDLAIIRVPSEPGESSVVLVAVNIDEDGYIEGEGEFFTVPEGDSYNEIDFDNIVIAQRHDMGSINPIRYHLGAEDTQVMKVCELTGGELRDIVRYLVEQYEANYEATRQKNSALEGDVRFVGSGGNTIQ